MTRRRCDDSLQCYESVAWDSKKELFDFHYPYGVGEVIESPYKVGERFAIIEKLEGGTLIYTGRDGEITEVRVERIKDISEEDCYKEGLTDNDRGCVGASIINGKICEIQGVSLRPYFAHLWKLLYGRDAWQRNDWVWVRGFKKV